MKELSSSQLDLIGRVTLAKTGGIGLENAEKNLPYLGKTIVDLMKSLPEGDRGSAMVVSAGPSLHLQHSIKRILESGFDGTVIAVDGALGHCLRNGLVPDYVVTVDPDLHRIVRWFGDTRHDEKPEDDYFRRQDLDPALHDNEIAYNERLIALVNEHGPRIRAAIATSVSPEVTERCIESGMELYWWNPLYDDFDEPDSVTRKVWKLNRIPAMVAGGNVGTAAWVFAHTVLGHSQVGMVGMDFGYAPGTQARSTQYFYELGALFDDAADGLIEIDNPYLGEAWLTDPTYYWYREGFLKLAAETEGLTTYNCTEGGILFGAGVNFATLDEFFDAAWR